MKLTTIVAVDLNEHTDELGQRVRGWTMVSLRCGHLKKCANHFAYHVGDRAKCFEHHDELEKAS